VLHNRVKTQGYEECQDDILVVSGMVEETRDALLEYQVGGKQPHAAAVCTNNWMVQQTTQQRAIYDQGCKLIVSRPTHLLRACLMFIIGYRMPVRTFLFLLQHELTGVLYSPPCSVE